MATTHVIKGGQKVQWGTEGVTSGLGIVTGVSEDAAIQFEKIENNQGAVVGAVIYDTETNTKIDITTDPTATPPKGGDMLSSVATGLPIGIITKIGKSRGNKQLTKHTIEGMSWANFTGA